MAVQENSFPKCQMSKLRQIRIKQRGKVTVAWAIEGGFYRADGVDFNPQRTKTTELRKKKKRTNEQGKKVRKMNDSKGNKLRL